MNKEEVLALLDSRAIEYEKADHPEVYTIDDMISLGLPHLEAIAKNLFVHDDKKQNYYLITVKEDKRVDLKDFKTRFSTRRLSFAKEEELLEILGLKKGAVTPLGILNDREKKVKFYLDEDFQGRTMGIHPNDNTSTIYIKTDKVLELIEDHGNEVHIVKL